MSWALACVGIFWAIAFMYWAGRKYPSPEDKVLAKILEQDRLGK